MYFVTLLFAGRLSGLHGGSGGMASALFRRNDKDDIVLASHRVGRGGIGLAVAICGSGSGCCDAAPRRASLYRDRARRRHVKHALGARV